MGLLETPCDPPCLKSVGVTGQASGLFSSFIFCLNRVLLFAFSKSNYEHRSMRAKAQMNSLLFLPPFLLPLAFVLIPKPS